MRFLNGMTRNPTADRGQAVVSVVDRDKADAELREYLFQIPPAVDVVSRKRLRSLTTMQSIAPLRIASSSFLKFGRLKKRRYNHRQRTVRRRFPDRHAVQC